jgi:outer membrane protein assembly factor BamB
MKSAVALLVSAFCLLPSALAADWPFFRGPARDGKSTDANAPVSWSKTKNVKWKVALPQPGNSSPIVIKDRVFVTGRLDKDGHQRALYCFNRKDGAEMWKKVVQHDAFEKTHDTNPHAASTPASDGERVVVWHGSAGLYCYDMSGNEIWKKDLGKFTHIWGYASSPVIHNGIVYLNAGPGVRQFVIALDVKEGNKVWEVEVPGGADDKSAETKSWVGSWGTPVIAKIGGQEQLLVFQSRRVNAHDLKSGKILWSVEGAGDLAYTDVVPTEGMAVALAGFTGAAIGFKTGGEGNMTESNRLWRVTQKIPQRIGSGVIVGNHIYIPNEPSIACIDITTGQQKWEQRIPGHTFWASIVQSGDRLYATSQKGTTFVFNPDPNGWKMLTSNDLGEKTNATPAISDGEIFIRTFNNLYCIKQ